MLTGSGPCRVCTCVYLVFEGKPQPSKQVMFSPGLNGRNFAVWHRRRGFSTLVRKKGEDEGTDRSGFDMVEFGGCFEPRQPSCDSGEGEGYFMCVSYNRLEAFAFGLEIHPGERKPERQRPGCTWACQKKGRRWELVTADESSIFAKPFLDAIVVEDCQRDRRLSDPASTGESDGVEVFCKTNNALNELFAPKTGSWRWGR